jgi:hypothetical protein
VKDAIKYLGSQQKITQMLGYSHQNIQYWKKKSISQEYEAHGFKPKTTKCLSFIDLSEEQESDL